MENPAKITALAITLNEAHNIEGYIKSLWFVDEIVIVDSFSSDETVALASKHEKVTVYQRTFDNFSAQKNFAISKAKNDWVTFFDLDEEVTPELANEILEKFKNPQAIAYFVKRDFYFMGKRIKYSGLQNDYIIRFFNKNHCRYNANLVHETLEADGNTENLKSSLPHHTYKSFDDYTAKMHQYSALQAKMLEAIEKLTDRVNTTSSSDGGGRARNPLKFSVTPKLPHFDNKNADYPIFSSFLWYSKTAGKLL